VNVMNVDFSETWVPIDTLLISAATTEQNSGYVSLAGYNRVAIIVHALIVTTTLDIDIEIATAVGGTNAVTLKSAAQLLAADDGDIIVFDIRPDELSNPANTSVNEFSWLNVELTPSGAATVSVIVLGMSAYRPGIQTLWSQAIS